MPATSRSAARLAIPSSILLSLLGACATSGTSIERDIDLVLAPTLEAGLTPHRPELPAAAELVTLDSSVAIDHKGNLGRIDKSEEQHAFQWLAEGRLASTSVGTFRSPTGVNQWTTSSISLCGLVPLLVESANASDGQSTVVVPVGRAFIPFGFSSKRQAASRSRIVSFAASTGNLCRPAPGASFTYQSTREEQRRFEGGMRSSNKLYTITESAACTVGADELPASALHASFAGKYLPVTCTYSQPSKSDRRSTFAYLLASRLYVPVSVQFNEYQSNTSHYTALRYK